MCHIQRKCGLHTGVQGGWNTTADEALRGWLQTAWKGVKFQLLEIGDGNPSNEDENANGAKPNPLNVIPDSEDEDKNRAKPNNPKAESQESDSDENRAKPNNSEANSEESDSDSSSSSSSASSCTTQRAIST